MELKKINRIEGLIKTNDEIVLIKAVVSILNSLEDEGLELNEVEEYLKFKILEILTKAKKIDSTKTHTKEELKDIFEFWSLRMDLMYNDEERHDATMWTINPGDWMEPFNNELIQQWCQDDVGAPIKNE